VRTAGRITVGDAVVIERDETRYPPKGTWPRFRGRVVTVVEINLGEYGVALGKTLPASGRRGGSMKGGSVTWFQPYELRITSRTVAPLAGDERTQTLLLIDSPREAMAHV